MAEVTAEAYLEQESSILEKVSRRGANDLRLEAKVMASTYHDEFAALIPGHPAAAKPSLDNVMDFMQKASARIAQLSAEQKDPQAAFHPRLHMRAHRIFREYEIKLASEYRDQATILYAEFENTIRRQMQSGLIPSSTAVSLHGNTVDADIVASQAEFDRQIDAWLDTVPSEVIVMTNKDVPLGFDFTGFDEAQDAKHAARISQRGQKQDVTDIDPATGKPVDAGIFAAIGAATSPFPTINRDEPQAVAYVAPEITPAPAPAPVASAPDQWSAEVLAKAADRIRERSTAKGTHLRSYIKDILVPLQQETMKELEARSAAGQTSEQVEHIFAYADFLRRQTRELRAEINARVAADQAGTASRIAQAHPQLDAATTRARAQLDSIKVEKPEAAPASTGWFSRAKAFFAPKDVAPVEVKAEAPVYAQPIASAHFNVWNPENLMTASANILKSTPKEAGPELAAFVESNLKKAQAAVAAELAKRGDSDRQNPQANSNLYIFADFVNDQLRQATQKLEAAAPKPAAITEIEAPQSERKGFFARMKDAASAGHKLVSGLTDRALEFIRPSVERVAAHSTAALVGVGAATVLGIGAAVVHDAPSITGLAKSATAVPEDQNPRFARGVVTQLPAAEFVAPAADPAAPVAVPTAAVVAPEPAKAAPAVKASFKAQSNEPYKMPESLKVAFADGTTSQFDKGTWAKACDKVGNQGEFCKEIALKHS